jgi:transcriptional regulator with XRE-family HTH domain
MVDINKLKGKMVENGLTQAQTAELIGIHKDTLGRKLRAGVFGTDEVEKLIDVLNIENPNEIFFAKK